LKYKISKNAFWCSLVSRAFYIISRLRFTPYDVNTPQGRSNERIRRLSWAALTAGLSKVGSLIIVVASVRWGVDYLGAERFGLWMTITSIVTLLSFADLGMGNSLVNLVSAAEGKNDTEAIRRGVSNGFAIMALVALVLGVLFFPIYFYIDWAKLTNVTEPKSVTEAGPSIGVYLIFFLISMPLSIVNRVQTGLQEGWRSNLWTFVGQIFALVGLVVVVYFNGGVPHLVLAVAGIPAVVTAINYIDFFFRQRRDICPRLGDVDREIVKRLANVSSIFLIMQFMAVMGSMSDNVIIAHLLGAAAVSSYAITQKLTMILGMSQILISPMWPAFGESISRGDHLWARRALTAVLLGSLIFGLISGIVILVYGSAIVRIWAGDQMEPGVKLIYGFSAFSILMSIGGALSVFLNNGEYLRRQALIFIIASIMSILLKFILVSYWQDAAGAIWGTVIGYTVFFIFPAIFIAYRSKTV
jgi:O-antigen/teichoic acid export membrane protein